MAQAKSEIEAGKFLELEVAEENSSAVKKLLAVEEAAIALVQDSSVVVSVSSINPHGGEFTVELQKGNSTDTVIITNPTFKVTKEKALKEIQSLVGTFEKKPEPFDLNLGVLATLEIQGVTEDNRAECEIAIKKAEKGSIKTIEALQDLINNVNNA